MTMYLETQTLHIGIRIITGKRRQINARTRTQQPRRLVRLFDTAFGLESGCTAVQCGQINVDIREPCLVIVAAGIAVCHDVSLLTYVSRRVGSGSRYTPIWCVGYTSTSERWVCASPRAMVRFGEFIDKY